MGLQRARQDMKRFTQAEWAVNITVDNLQGLVVALKGIASKHHLSIDVGNGLPVNSKNTHCSFYEKVLTDAGFVVRNSDKEIAMVGWKITYIDSSENSCVYKINETMPDETLGLIVCYLGDYG